MGEHETDEFLKWVGSSRFKLIYKTPAAGTPDARPQIEVRDASWTSRTLTQEEFADEYVRKWYEEKHERKATPAESLSLIGNIVRYLQEHGEYPSL